MTSRTNSTLRSPGDGDATPVTTTDWSTVLLAGGTAYLGARSFMRSMEWATTIGLAVLLYAYAAAPKLQSHVDVPTGSAVDERNQANFDAYAKGLTSGATHLQGATPSVR